MSTSRSQNWPWHKSIASAEADVINRLEPLPLRWPLHAFCAALLTIVLTALVSITGRASLAWTIGIVGGLVTIGVAVIGARQRARDLSVTGAVEAVSQIAGARVPSRSIVTFSQWPANEWVGVPGKIRVRYSATTNDEDPKFVSSLSEQLSRRLGTTYRLRDRHPSRCVATFELDPSAAEDTPEAEQRAIDVTHMLFGQSATVDVQTDSTGEVVESMDIEHKIGPRLALSGYRARLERVVGSMLPGRWRAAWDLESDSVHFELRPEMPAMIVHTPSQPADHRDHDAYMAAKIVYGTDEDGRPVFWRPSKQPHMLVVGGTGSGKTSVEHTILTELALHNWRVWVLDGKRIEFIGFRGWQNVQLIASRLEHQVRMVHAAHELMMRRYDKIELGQATVRDFEPLVVVIDEYATFREGVERWYRAVKPKGGPPHAPALDLIGDIARLGRSAKVHLVLGIQRPDASFLGGEMRDNFAARMSLGRLSPEGARMMWDSYTIGVVRTPQGQGVTLDEGGDPVEALAHYTPDPAKTSTKDTDDLAAIEALRPDDAVWPQQKIVDPRPDLDADGADGVEFTYSDYAAAPIMAASVADRFEVTSTFIDPVGEDPAQPPAGTTSDDDPDQLEGYGAAEERSASSVEAGDLLQIDAVTDSWGVIESAEPDLLDDSQIVISVRDVETGEPDGISVDAGDYLAVRSPTSN